MGIRWTSLSKAQENLFTVHTVLGECTSPGMEHSYLIPESINYCVQIFLTYFHSRQ